MPIYTYFCDECAVDSERIVKMDDRDKQYCNLCEHKLRRGIDRPGLVWAPTASNSGVTRA